MSLSKFNPRTVILVIFILLIAFMRIIFNTDKSLSIIINFSPIGALAIFGGTYFNKQWKAFCFPVLTLFVSDLILSFTVYSQYRHGLLYGGWFWTYSAFSLMTLVGQRIIKNVKISTVLLAALACTFIHWIVSDFGVWLHGSLYEKTIGGFIACLIAAIPFEFSFLAGTLIYSTILFGLFEYMKQKYTALKITQSGR